MIEVMDTQAIPYAATAAGFAAGTIIDRLAIRKAAQERAALVEDWQLADLEPARQVSGFAKLAHKAGRLITPLSVTMGIAAGLSAEAWLPLHETAKQTNPAVLEMVVDHSGATALDLNGTPPKAEINNIVDQFRGQPLKTEIFVAGSGRIQPMELKDVSKNQAFGDAPLTEAVQLAIDKAGLAATKAETVQGKRPAGVLVLTNGNKIGGINAIVSAAKKESETPIFVVNVEGGQGATSNNLQAIAKATHGRYWDAHAKNIKSVASDVRQTISPDLREHTNPTASESTRDFLKLLSVLSLIGVGLGYTQRGKMPFQRNVKGK